MSRSASTSEGNLAKKSHHLVVSIPIDDVDMILDALEQTLDDIKEAQCDCDDCDRMSEVLEDFVSKVLSAAPIKT
jgi:hypothetical protein